MLELIILYDLQIQCYLIIFINLSNNKLNFCLKTKFLHKDLICNNHLIIKYKILNINCLYKLLYYL